MIRWAGCGLVVLLAGTVGFGQTEDVVRELSSQLRPNPFGGLPIFVQPIALQKVKVAPIAPWGAPLELGPERVGGQNPRPLRPVYTLPGAPKLDRHGDPLPSGAVVRFGTVRLRHGANIQALGFTPDGKSLCTVSGNDDSIRMWDAASGKEIARLAASAHLIGLAKTGSVFLVDETRVRVWVPGTGAVRDLPEKTIPEGNNATALAVNPDGRSFALAVEGKVLLIDAQTGKATRELNLPGPPPNPNNNKLALRPNGQPNGQPTPPPVRLMYSPDGRWLVGNGQKTGVWLWDLRTGKRVRTYHSAIDFPEYTFSPDVTKLAVTGQQVHLYALDSEEAVDGFKPPEGLGMCFAPRFSADGKTLFVITPEGHVQPMDAATGEEKDELEAPEMNLRQPFALAPEAATAAAVDQSGGIRLWDPKTGKGPEVSRLPGLLNPGISADGKSVTVLDQTRKLRTFDLATGAAGKVIELPGEDIDLPAVWDPVSRRVALLVAGGDDMEVRVVDADTGKEVSKFSVPQNIPSLAFAAANRDRLMLVGPAGVQVVNPTTGKTVRNFAAGNQEGNGNNGGAISPDGRLVALEGRWLTVWEVASGKKRLTVEGVQNVSEVAFSPDSRLLVAWDNSSTIVVVDVRNGTIVRRLQSPDTENAATTLAVSSDGKRVAAGMNDGRVTVWDVASGDILVPFAGHDGLVTSVVFTADGKKLVSTAQDGTALVWEIPDKPVSTGPMETEVTGFDEAFRLLGSADAAHAQRGLDYLYRHPVEAAKQASERVPVPVATPSAKVNQLVDDLGSDEFQTREAARAALEKIGGEAFAALKQAAEKSGSAEIRKTATELLGKLDAPTTRAEDLRIVRAVEAMENLRSPEGRAQLEKWSAGPAGHRLTVEAAAALARVKALGGK
jgi:WD40 repeat protein